MKIAIAAIFCLIACNAEARPIHHHHHHHKHHYKHAKVKAHSLKKPKPIQVASLGNEALHEAPTGLAAQASRYLGLGARQLGVRSTLWCSAFIRKLTNTKGVDDRAISWIRRPRIKEGKDAIAVMAHHVGIVKSVSKDYVVLISGNHGHKVGIGRYPKSRIIAYVSA